MQENKRVAVEGLPMVDQVEVGLPVSEILPGGIAEAVGILPGDRIHSINGQPVRDAIDYRFHIGEEEVEVLVDRDGEFLIYEIEKSPDEDLGLVPGDMPIVKCDNKCVFCFLHQMPKGMRKTLYYQDDDYRLSFLHGAYVTLTNLSQEEFDRIVQQRLSPMYISVHATDPQLRADLLGRPDPVDVMERIQYLADNGIQMHAQIVLCPGLNDGAHLKRTVFDLASRYPDVESVGIVPLGLTKFRKNLPELDPVTPQVAAECVQQVTEWQRHFKERFGTNYVYLGDEFYLQCRQEVPDSDRYDGFPLVENGIGMVRRFIDTFEQGFPELGLLSPPPLRVTLVTSVLGANFVRPISERLNTLPWLHVVALEVQNRFFGDGITVSGLLTGADILHALEAHAGAHELVILPPNCISHHGLLLDDFTPADLEKALGCRVVVGTYDLAETIIGLATSAGPVFEGHQAGEAPHPYITSHQLD
ncbi:MAG: DUF512 domain-containing protein [bacterium]|nr:DUF512 domain-containing protein [bacterium]